MFFPLRTALERLCYYDDTRKIVNLNDKAGVIPPCSSISTEKFALPITETCSRSFLALQEKGVSLPHPFDNCFISELHLLPSHANTKEKFQSAILKLLSESVCDVASKKMAESIPTSWERHGDLVVLPSASFSDQPWQSYLDSLSESQLSNFWCVVAISLKCKRLAIGSKVADDSFRSSKVTLLLGDNGWVDHVDNGIHYMFDVTRCMFSSGNITEKIRLGNIDCSGETVVDLYAGIGYFILPYLVHAQAVLVHACEWNPDAVEALRKGLKANRVEDRCIVHYGDNRKVNIRLQVILLTLHVNRWMVWPLL